MFENPTEPILIVLGDPIAGNPTQLAIERALDAVGADWRVVSLSVRRDDLDVALAGLRVLNFGGVWLDQKLAAQSDSDASKTLFGNDFFGPQNEWSGAATRQRLLGELVRIDHDIPSQDDLEERTVIDEGIPQSMGDPFEIDADEANGVSAYRIEIMSLAWLVHQLTGENVDEEILRDAVEEYQSV